MPSSPVVKTVLRAVPRLRQPHPPPPQHTDWWERGVLDGVETMKVFALEALAVVDDVAEATNATEVRSAVAALQLLFTVNGPRRPDGRLDEVWIPRPPGAGE